MRISMRGHLSAEELVDALDATLPALRSAHLASCEACRERAGDLRRLADVARNAKVPEPSPLFWDRFSARVSAAIRTEPAPSQRGLILDWTRRVAPFAATAVIVVALVAGLLPRGTSPHTPAVSTGSGSAPVLDAAGSGADALMGPTEDPSWTLVTELSASVSADQVENTAFDPKPGSADQAATQLSGQERRELVRLLRAELRGSATPSLKE